MEELIRKASLRVAERIKIFEIASHFNEYYPIHQNIVYSVIKIDFSFKYF